MSKNKFRLRLYQEFIKRAEERGKTILEAPLPCCKNIYRSVAAIEDYDSMFECPHCGAIGRKFVTSSKLTVQFVLGG